MADPVPGLGMAVPIFMPVLVTAVVAVTLSREDSAPLAYIAGSLGTFLRRMWSDTAGLPAPMRTGPSRGC
jgi:uncharacterized membrane protein